MRLSVDSINDKAPCWVIQLDDMLFRFVSRNGIKYRVGFYPDKYFLEEGAYHFFLQNVSNVHSPYDPEVLEIVTIIIEEFFKEDTNVMLYICDPYDQRQEYRSRLYRLWFNTYKNHNEFTLSDARISFKNSIVYAGLIIKKTNPLYEPVLDAFDDFIHLIPYDLSIAGK